VGLGEGGVGTFSPFVPRPIGPVRKPSLYWTRTLKVESAHIPFLSEFERDLRIRLYVELIGFGRVSAEFRLIVRPQCFQDPDEVFGALVPLVVVQPSLT
jgi:hypothetical protein